MPKLAIVHDFFVRVGGAERVLIAMHRLWPDAPIHLLVADRRAVRTHLSNADVRISPLGHLWGIPHYYAALALAMPSATEMWDLSAYDTVLSSSVLFAKGVVVRPDSRHISYCYSPPRMLWDRTATYERTGIASSLTRHVLRTWDQAAAQRPDTLVAISQTVASRINVYWHRDAMVIPPPNTLPVTADADGEREGYFLVVARLMAYKNLGVVIDAFNKTRTPLVIAGDGPLYRRLARRAGPTVKLVGAVSDATLSTLYARAAAVVVPNDEDFGLTAVEAMAHGTPVLALRSGGALETVVEGMTGEFFDDPIPESLADGIKRIRAIMETYSRTAIREHAARWSLEHWVQRMRTLVEPC